VAAGRGTGHVIVKTVAQGSARRSRDAAQRFLDEPS
jgi:hypothetical protein